MDPPSSEILGCIRLVDSNLVWEGAPMGAGLLFCVVSRQTPEEEKNSLNCRDGRRCGQGCIARTVVAFGGGA